jgi:galactose-1-phosphate uridylyltransferase
MTIEFQSREDRFALLNPLKDFTPDTQTIQVRKDPLLGHMSVYNPLMEEGIKMFVGKVDRELVEQMSRDSAPHCFFCPDKIEGVARFAPDFIPEGTIEVGETVLFPNLFALGRHHAVAAISRAHFLELDAFTPQLLGDAFRAIQRYIAAVHAHDGEAHNASVNANYLFPAGASLMHPHFQVILSAEPYSHQARLHEACRAYAEANGEAYHRALVREERELGERCIAQTGAWHWLAAYSPMGSNEVLGVHDQSGDFSEIHEDDLSSLARGLSCVLRTYARLGYLSFNFSLYSRRNPDPSDGFNCMIRCFTRQNPYPNYRTDDFFMQKGLQTELILKLPEALTSEMKLAFASTP